MADLTQFALRRIGQSVVVIWGIITLVFLLRFLTPQDPAALVAPDNASPALIDQIRQDLGLTDPIVIQYFRYLADVVQGDLGFSYGSGVHVNDLILGALPATLELAFAALVFALVISIPLGVLSANRRGTNTDAATNIISLGGLSTPNFWLGIMLILLVPVQLGVLPTGGRVGPTQDLVAWMGHMILPTIALGTYFMALLFRMTRNNVIEELNKEYVRAARAKGLPENIITVRYVLQNSMAPVITVAGLQLGLLIGGSVVVEAVFNWPGIGSLFIQALNTADWPIMQGILIVVGIGYVAINIVVDILNAKLNPQVSLS